MYLYEYIRDNHSSTIREIAKLNNLSPNTIQKRWSAWRSLDELLLPSQGIGWPRIVKHHFYYDYKWPKCRYNRYIKRVRAWRPKEIAIKPIVMKYNLEVPK